MKVVLENLIQRTKNSISTQKIILPDWKQFLSGGNAANKQDQLFSIQTDGEFITMDKSVKKEMNMIQRGLIMIFCIRSIS
jgi:hypothetical protein